MTLKEQTLSKSAKELCAPPYYSFSLLQHEKAKPGKSR